MTVPWYRALRASSEYSGSTRYSITGGVIPPLTWYAPSQHPPSVPSPPPGPFPFPSPRPSPLPIPPPVPSPDDGGPTTPLGSPILERSSVRSIANCGATIVGSTINVGSGFFGGSALGGTSCLSAP